MSEQQPILRVENLYQQFKSKRNALIPAVNGVSFDIFAGETFALVGETGSGKSTIGRTIIRLYQPSSGLIEFHGQMISDRLTVKTKRLIRTNMQMIFQDVTLSLNPRRKVFDIIGEGCKGLLKEEKIEKIYFMLSIVDLLPEHAQRYPHQLSGGQRQRVGIARALITNPDLIIADEIISAVDISIQTQIIHLLKEIQAKTNVAYLFISHDLAAVKRIAHRVGVLHHGYMVEMGTTEEVFSRPIHVYTKKLLNSAFYLTSNANNHPPDDVSLINH